MSDKPSKKDLLSMLDEMVRNYENLPPHAAVMPITHYDLAASLILISELFRADCKDPS